MKKKVIIGLVIALAVIAIVLGIIFMNNKPKEEAKTNLVKIEKAEDLSNLINEIYKGKEENLPRLNTQIVDVNDSDAIKSAIGLENGNDFEFVAISEPMISSQAYSLVLAKVKDNVNASNVAKEMSERINTRKWICVSAEKLYATNSGDIVCLVMSNEEWAKPVYDELKKIAGQIGEEFTKTEELLELPEELLPEEL